MCKQMRMKCLQEIFFAKHFPEFHVYPRRNISALDRLSENRTNRAEIRRVVFEKSKCVSLYGKCIWGRWKRMYKAESGITKEGIG